MEAAAKAARFAARQAEVEEETEAIRRAFGGLAESRVETTPEEAKEWEEEVEEEDDDDDENNKEEEAQEEAKEDDEVAEK